MALINLWTGPNAITGTSLSNSKIVYLPSEKCFFTAATHEKIYHDGTRIILGTPTLASYSCYDWNTNESIFYSSSTVRYRQMPISLFQNTSSLSAFTTTLAGSTYTSFQPIAEIYGSVFYYVILDGGVYKLRGINVATGATVSTLTWPRATAYADTPAGNYFLPNYIAWNAQRTQLIACDWSNTSFSGLGTVGVIQVLDATTLTLVFESVFPEAINGAYDVDNNILWTIRASDSKPQVHAMQAAPSAFSGLALATSAARYKSVAASVSLLGTRSEPVQSWPVGWSLTTAQGKLLTDYSLTDSSGIARNTYFGPGVSDYTGANQTINVTTGY